MRGTPPFPEAAAGPWAGEGPHTGLRFPGGPPQKVLTQRRGEGSTARSRGSFHSWGETGSSRIIPKLLEEEAVGAAGHPARGRDAAGRQSHSAF